MQFLPMRYQLLVILRHPVFTIRNWWNTQRARREAQNIMNEFTEGKVKKGGWHSPPTTPKPNIKPVGQGVRKLIIVIEKQK